MKNLKKLLTPQSIAIIGASPHMQKIGTTIMTNLAKGGYEGRIYPVNPKHAEILGLECFPNLASIPHKVELAIMAIPAKLTESVLDDCEKRGVKNLVIISSGFTEVGGKGIELQKKLKEKAKEYDINILGPNCLGLIVSENKMNASFAAMHAKPGNIAFFSQSGAICTSVLDMANERNIGFSHFISIGNKAVLNENDFVQEFEDHKEVNVIGGYLEDFADGFDFANIGEDKKEKKPTVILHPGKSDAAKKAISSHTGSLASSEDVLNAAFKKHRIIRAENLNELLAFTNILDKIEFDGSAEHIKTLIRSHKDKKPKIAIVTNAGGPGVLATDLIVENGFEFSKLNAKTKLKLEKFLPPAASVNNPVDMLGDATADRYKHIIEILAENEKVDSIVVLLTPQTVTQIEETAKVLVDIINQSGKPIIPVFLGGQYVRAGMKRFFDNNIAAFDSMGLAIKALKKWWDFHLQGINKRSKPKLPKKQARKPSVKKILKEYMSEEPTPLPEPIVQKILKDFGIRVPRTAIVHTLEQAVHAWEKMYGKFESNISGTHTFGSIVLKATTEDIIHKTDFKAIYADIGRLLELEENLTKLQHDIYKKTGRENPAVLLQEQIRSSKEELFIGVKRDGDHKVYGRNGTGFGHLILFGKGGIYTEAYKDFAHDILPMNKEEIIELTGSTKVSKIVDGYRGSKPLAKAKLVDLISRIQKVVVTYPEIAEMDFNPVMIDEDDLWCVDVKMFVKS